MSHCFLLFREAVDTEGDGDVSKEEFVKNAMQSKFIFNMLKNWIKAAMQSKFIFNMLKNWIKNAIKSKFILNMLTNWVS